MENIQNWKVSLISLVKKDQLTNSQVDTVLDCFSNEDYQSYLQTMKESNKKYDIYPITKWQLEKAREIEKKFFDGLSHTIDGHNINVSVDFEINFPEEFDKDEIGDWIEDLNRLQKIYPYIKQKQMMRDWGSIDENLRYKEECFIEELVFNQKIEISKL